MQNNNFKYLRVSILLFLITVNSTAQKDTMYIDNLISITASSEYKCFIKNTKRLCSNCYKDRGAMDDFNVYINQIIYNSDSTKFTIKGRVVNYITNDNYTSGLPLANIFHASNVNNRLYNFELLTTTTVLKVDAKTKMIIIDDGYFEFSIDNAKPKNYFYVANYSGKMKEMIMHQRKKGQSIIDKTNDGKILKTYDGMLYREFDTIGRMVCIYGNHKSIEQPSNFKNIIEYKKDTDVVKQYLLNKKNKNFKIADSLDCYISLYIYQNKKIKSAIQYNRVYKNKKIIGHQIVDINENITFNPFEKSLDDYSIID